MKKLLIAAFAAAMAVSVACTGNLPTTGDEPVQSAPAIEQGYVTASGISCTITAVVTPIDGNPHYVQVTGNHDAKAALINLYGKTTQSSVWTLYGPYSPFLFMEYWNPGGNTAVYAQVQIRRKSDGYVLCYASRYIGPGLP